MRKLIQRLKSRRGSVLIFVVGLLVLLALIGTAWINTTRTDRYSTQQNSVNTSLDLLVEGVANLVEAQVVDPLFNGGNQPRAQGNYLPVEGSGIGVSAPRLPRVPNRAGVAVLDTNANNPYWTHITPPPNGARYLSVTGNEYSLAGRPPLQVTSRTDAGGNVLPAFRTVIAPPNDGTPSWGIVPALDADGDGIGDALPVRVPIANLPTGTINGFDSSQITWVYGVRVVDLASAVNINTALTGLSDFRRGGSQPIEGGSVSPLVSGAFPSHVDLFSLMRSSASSTPLAAISSFTASRPDFGRLLSFTLNTPANYLVSGLAEPNGFAATSGGGINPRDDSNFDRTDWVYFSLGDALHQGLARRIENPGFADNNKKFRAYPFSSELSLVSRFAIAPEAQSAQIERDLADTLYTNVRRVPYVANDIPNWFNQNFAYDLDLGAPTLNWRPRRALVTTQSRTSNLAPFPALALPMGPALPTSASFNSRTMPRTSINSATFDEKWRAFFLVMAEPDVGGWRTPYGVDDDVYSRANMFTGMTFGTLPPSPANGVPTPIGSAPLEAQTPNLFDPPQNSATAGADQHRYRMFRSVTRTPPPASAGQETYIPPSEVAKLRAAIAARGVADQYDGDIDVSNTIIPLSVLVNGTPVVAQAVVYGNERQPVIASVYANTNISTTLPQGATLQNTVPYVAIKLFNPSPDKYVVLYDPSIDNAAGTREHRWQLVGIKRGPTDVPPYRFPADHPSGTGRLVVQFWDTTEVTPMDGNTTIEIPPLGYLLLENYNENDPAHTVQHRPLGSNLPVTGPPTLPAGPAPGATETRRVFVPDLASFLDHELVLMRWGKERASFPAAQAANIENPDNLQSIPQWAPVDHFDFTGLTVDATFADTRAWYYSRPTGTYGAPEWMRFFYPGRYDPRRETRRHQGTYEAVWDASDPANTEVTLPGVNLIDHVPLGGATFPRTFAFQLFGLNFPSYNPTPETYVTGVTYRQGRKVFWPATGTFWEVTALQTTNPPGGGDWANTGEKIIFPYHGYQRDLDIMCLSFAGPYRIHLASGANTLIEVNAVTMDLAFAEDTDVDTDESAPGNVANGSQFFENIGRFAPVLIPQTSPNSPFINDFQFTTDPIVSYNHLTQVYDNTDAQTINDTVTHRYRWTNKLTQYVGVRAPHDDFTPNVANPAYTAFRPEGPGQGPGIWMHPTQQRLGTQAGNRSNVHTEQTHSLIPPYDPPTPAGQSDNVAHAYSEDTIPVYGLININTAPARVLGALPWLPPVVNGSGQVSHLDVIHYQSPAHPSGFYLGPKRTGDPDIADNEQIGQIIEDYRDGVWNPGSNNWYPGFEPNGPFFAIHDLYNIGAFRQIQQVILLGTEPSNAQGDYSPKQSANTDGVRFDFEEQFLMLNRVSNLITTHSDAFVVYIVVQGWVNVGTANVETVVERRTAFIVDRSNVTFTDRTPVVYRVPTE